MLFLLNFLLRKTHDRFRDYSFEITIISEDAALRGTSNELGTNVRHV